MTDGGEAGLDRVTIATHGSNVRDREGWNSRGLSYAVRVVWIVNLEQPSRDIGKLFVTPNVKNRRST